MPTPAFRTEVPTHPYDVLLARPTRDSVTVSVLSYADRDGHLVFGPESGPLDRETPPKKLIPGEPVEWKLTNLKAGTRYRYRFRSRPPGSSEFVDGTEGIFTTARLPGTTFRFTVQADSHLDFGTDPDVYRKSLTNALAAGADFHIDLGDTFMTDKYLRFTDATPHYLAQRFYFGLLGHSVPLFLVLGNHDGELPSRGGSGPDSMSAWSIGMRKKYFPNPVPDGFYSGNAIADPHSGLREDYFAWEWGDALFVVLDPFWYSTRGRRGTGDNWGWTLGTDQYQWLNRTLETTRARFRFVFIHHLVGGETAEGRGGSEASRYYEWGGADISGTNSFTRRRPTWALPIHDLLAKHRVRIVFHGHDHLYARQEREGVVYQEVPQPGHTRADNLRSAPEYGYREGTLQGSSGILRVTVSPEEAMVEYVRAYPADYESKDHHTGEVTDRYRILPAAPQPDPHLPK